MQHLAAALLLHLVMQLVAGCWLLTIAHLLFAVSKKEEFCQIMQNNVEILSVRK